MWEIYSETITNCPIKSLEPHEVLYWYDGPMTFTVMAEGDLYIAHYCANDGPLFRFIVSKINEQILKNMQESKIDLRTGLLQPICYIIDIINENHLEKVWQVQPEEVPANVLPVQGITLYGPYMREDDSGMRYNIRDLDDAP